MLKARKKILGIIGLLLVALMTAFAYFLPSESAYAEGAGTDTVQVIVYDSTAAVDITAPASETITTSSTITTTFVYENVSYIELWLDYEDEDGNPQSVQISTYNPAEGPIDPMSFYTGSGSSTFNLADHTLTYNTYTLTTKAYSPAGYDEDSVSFYYVPAIVEQNGAEEETNNPIIDIEYGDHVGKIEIMPIDDDGNDLLEEPIIVMIEPDEGGDYKAGTKTIALPFTANKFASGKYSLFVTSYYEPEEEVYSIIDSSIVIFDVEYTKPTTPDDPDKPDDPDAPSVPDTGVSTKETSVAKTDLAITIALVFMCLLAVVLTTVLRPKKFNYRKNIRSRK